MDFSLLWFGFDLMKIASFFGCFWIMKARTNKKETVWCWKKYLNCFWIQHHKRFPPPTPIQSQLQSHLHRQYKRLKKNITSGPFFDFINFIFHFYVIKVKFFIQFTTLWNGWGMFESIFGPFKQHCKWHQFKKLSVNANNKISSRVQSATALTNIKIISNIWKVSSTTDRFNLFSIQ